MTKKILYIIGCLSVIALCAVLVWRFYLYGGSIDGNLVNPKINNSVATSSLISIEADLHNLDRDFQEANQFNQVDGNFQIVRDIDRGEYWKSMNVLPSGTGDFIVKYRNSGQEIGRVPFTSLIKAITKDIGDVSQISKRLGEGHFFVDFNFITTEPKKIYILFTADGIENESSSSKWYIYGANFDGSDIRLIHSDSGFCNNEIILSYDQHSMALVCDTKENIWPYDAAPKATIIELPSGKTLASFLIPGDSQKFGGFPMKHGKPDEYYGREANVIGAWLMDQDGGVDFTRYYKIDGDPFPISDKEYWHFDSNTNQMTLLKTVPFGKYTTR